MVPLALAGPVGLVALAGALPPGASAPGAAAPSSLGATAAAAAGSGAGEGVMTALGLAASGAGAGASTGPAASGARAAAAAASLCVSAAGSAEGAGPGPSAAGAVGEAGAGAAGAAASAATGPEQRPQVAAQKFLQQGGRNGRPGSSPGRQGRAKGQGKCTRRVRASCASPSSPSGLVCESQVPSPQPHPTPPAPGQHLPGGGLGGVAVSGLLMLSARQAICSAWGRGGVGWDGIGSWFRWVVVQGGWGEGRETGTKWGGCAHRREAQEGQWLQKGAHRTPERK